MYPWFRMIKSVALAWRQPKLEWSETHVNNTMCWPWDLDPWNELNNGRALTLFDLGRIGWTVRMDIMPVMRQKRWGFAVAGSTIRYRRRVQWFHKLEIRTRITCWDDKFFYYEQSAWKSDGECAFHGVLRAAVTSKNGIVPPSQMIAALGKDIETPEVPEWIKIWSSSETKRPWPPMSEAILEG